FSHFSSCPRGYSGYRSRVIERLLSYSRIISDGADRYACCAYGEERPDSLWEGWLVFFPLDGGRPLATDRETTQPRREHVVYWAEGISPIFLEGALARARRLRPEAVLARHAQFADEQAARARAEAAEYERVAAEARAQAEAAERRR